MDAEETRTWLATRDTRLNQRIRRGDEVEPTAIRRDHTRGYTLFLCTKLHSSGFAFAIFKTFCLRSFRWPPPRLVSSRRVATIDGSFSHRRAAPRRAGRRVVITDIETIGCTETTHEKSTQQNGMRDSNSDRLFS